MVQINGAATKFSNDKVFQVLVQNTYVIYIMYFTIRRANFKLSKKKHAMTGAATKIQNNAIIKKLL